MKFETARKAVKLFLAGGIAFCIIALIMGSKTQLGTVCTFIALGCIVLCLFVAITCVKCPYCGTRIFRNLLVVKVCPHCKRDLVSGTKVKGSKKR